jgi:hypothetical protein
VCLKPGLALSAKHHGCLPACGSILHSQARAAA